MTGQLSYYGEAIREGAIMALEEAKANQPDSPIANIKIDWQDNASDPKTAVSILQKHKLTLPIFTSLA